MTRLMRALALLCICILTGCSLATSAGPSATLTWKAPVTNTDGSAVTDALAYNIYQGASGAETLVASKVAGLTWSTTAGLAPGSTVCWQVSAFDTVDGMESAKSAEACKTFAPLVPNPPTDLQVQ